MLNFLPSKNPTTHFFVETKIDFLVKESKQKFHSWHQFKTSAKLTASKMLFLTEKEYVVSLLLFNNIPRSICQKLCHELHEGS